MSLWNDVPTSVSSLSLSLSLPLNLTNGLWHFDACLCGPRTISPPVLLLYLSLSLSLSLSPNLLTGSHTGVPCAFLHLTGQAKEMPHLRSVRAPQKCDAPPPRCVERALHIVKNAIPQPLGCVEKSTPQCQKCDSSINLVCRKDYSTMSQMR